MGRREQPLPSHTRLLGKRLDPGRAVLGGRDVAVGDGLTL